VVRAAFPVTALGDTVRLGDRVGRSRVQAACEPQEHHDGEPPHTEAVDTAIVEQTRESTHRNLHSIFLAKQNESTMFCDGQPTEFAISFMEILARLVRQEGDDPSEVRSMTGEEIGLGPMPVS
jgi:hypothetical protein